jgi:methyltransferase (TIGR00027 family)
MNMPMPTTNSGPSRTSQAVALTRAQLTRPHSAGGNPDAQRALCAGLDFSPPDWLRPGIEARTRFMDEQVVSAIGRGTGQVVIFGAGLDDRALRFRTAGVRFFELDHPVTQADKAARLRRLAAGPGDAPGGPVLVPCDFQADEAGAVLAAAGHDPAEPTLFLCEGLLVYLDQQAGRRLLAASASVAAPGSVLAASLATHDSHAAGEEVTAAANARRRAASAEPWRTILRRDEYLALLAETGWDVTSVTAQPAVTADVSHGRRSLLVTAEPAGAG